MWGHDENLLNTTEFAQPALFAVEVALYRLLESWGVRPDFVMGHSVGELTAAHVAGALSLENAALLVVARGRFMQALPAGGAMVARAGDRGRRASAADRQRRHRGGERTVVGGGVRRRSRGDGDRGPAARPGPPGPQARGVACFPLAADGADDRRIQAAARGLAVNPVAIPVISNVTGELAGDDFATADYWTQHIRAAVRFADSVRYANSAGASRFLEVGPGGGLTSSIEESLAEAEIVSVPLLRKDRPEPNSLTAGVARAFVSGVGVDWRAMLPGSKFVELPTYAFERRRFWLSNDDAAVDAAGLGLAGRRARAAGRGGGTADLGRSGADRAGCRREHRAG